MEGKANLAGSVAVLKCRGRKPGKIKLDLRALHSQLTKRAVLAIAEDDLRKSTYAPFNAFVTVKDTEEKSSFSPALCSDHCHPDWGAWAKPMF
jgi:hypothetical protein